MPTLSSYAEAGWPLDEQQLNRLRATITANRIVLQRVRDQAPICSTKDEIQPHVSEADGLEIFWVEWAYPRLRQEAESWHTQFSTLIRRYSDVSEKQRFHPRQLTGLVADLSAWAGECLAWLESITW